jgi:S1-C subfamily serine protease
MSFQSVVPSVSLITLLKAGVPNGTATGFFYKRGDKLFLVTNNHVCRDESDPSQPSIPDLLRLRLHTSPSDLTQNGDYDVPLYAGSRHLWRNPPSNPAADVAVIELDLQAVTSRFTITHWGPEALLPANRLLYPGEDIFIMGYPLGFYDEVNNLPVFRNAMIASTYRVHFMGQPLFLTDGNFHPGTSGSPVISKPKNAWVDASGNTAFVTGTNYYLLGVHSGTYSRLQNRPGQPPIQIPLGLGLAWYAELVEETAATF